MWRPSLPANLSGMQLAFTNYRDAHRCFSFQGGHSRMQVHNSLTRTAQQVQLWWRALVGRVEQADTLVLASAS